MNIRVEERAVYEEITPDQLRDYLVQKNWNPVGHTDSCGLEWWETSGTRHRDACVPTDTEHPCYWERMQGAIRNLAIAERRKELDLLLEFSPTLRSYLSNLLNKTSMASRPSTTDDTVRQ